MTPQDTPAGAERFPTFTYVKMRSQRGKICYTTQQKYPPRSLPLPEGVEASQRLGASVWGIGPAISSSPHGSQTVGNYSIPQERRLHVYERDGWKCVYCGVRLAKREELVPSPYQPDSFMCPEGYEFPTVDHVVPKARGGNHKVENLVACCASCNSSKGGKTAEEWVGSASWSRRQENARHKISGWRP